jgi:hypothetical protein
MINESASRAHALRRAAAANTAGEPDYSIPNSEEDTLQNGALCRQFLGNTGFIIYQVCALCYLFTTLWSYAAVVVGSLSADVPIPGVSNGLDCTDACGVFPGGCNGAYLIYMALFLVSSLCLGLRDLTEQAFIQLLFTAFRYITLTAMVICVTFALWDAPYSLNPAHWRASAPYVYQPTTWWSFDLFTIGTVISTSCFSQVMHHSVPVLSRPVRDKENLNSMLLSVFATTFVLYCLIGVVCGAFFGIEANPLVSLNWESWAGELWHNSAARTVMESLLAHVIILFPAASIISSFPLNAITLAENLAEFIPASNKWDLTPKQIKLITRVVAIVPPILVAACLRCLSLIFQVAGLIGFALCYVFPPLLSIQSRRRAAAVFGEDKAATPYTSWWNADWFCICTICLAAVFLILTLVSMA